MTAKACIFLRAALRRRATPRVAWGLTAPNAKPPAPRGARPLERPLSPSPRSATRASRSSGARRGLRGVCTAALSRRRPPTPRATDRRVGSADGNRPPLGAGRMGSRGAETHGRERRDRAGAERPQARRRRAEECVGHERRTRSGAAEAAPREARARDSARGLPQRAQRALPQRAFARVTLSVSC